MKNGIVSNIVFNTRFCAIFFIVFMIAFGQFVKHAAVIDDEKVMEELYAQKKFGRGENFSLINYYVNRYDRVASDEKQQIRELFFFLARTTTPVVRAFSLNALFRITRKQNEQVLILAVEFANSPDPLLQEYARWLLHIWKDEIPEDLYKKHVVIREP